MLFFARFLFLLFCVLEIVSNSCFGSGIAEEYEVSAVISPVSDLMVAGTMSRDTDGMNCSFSTSTDLGKSWIDSKPFRHFGFAIGGNPTLAIDPDGLIYKMCMGFHHPVG